MSGRACLSADSPARSVQAGGVQVCQVERSRDLINLHFQVYYQNVLRFCIPLEPVGHQIGLWPMLVSFCHSIFLFFFQSILLVKHH